MQRRILAVLRRLVLWRKAISNPYPGVDPDGKSPGGITAAGDVAAARLLVGNQVIANSAFTKTTLKRAAQLTVAAADTPYLPFATVVYDPLGSADLLNNGITVTETGLYLAGLIAEIATNDASAGDIALVPNCQGAAGPDVNTATVVHIGASTVYSFTWFLYMHVAAPDTFSIELDNNTLVDVHITAYELSLARLT